MALSAAAPTKGLSAALARGLLSRSVAPPMRSIRAGAAMGAKRQMERRGQLPRPLMPYYQQQRNFAAKVSASTAQRGDFARLTAEDLDYLRKNLSEGSVQTPEEVGDEQELSRYNCDWMGKWFGKTSCVLKPATTEEVSLILRYANERNLAIVPQGGNTGLVGGSVPVFDELVLSLKRMNQVENLDKISGIVTVEAGMVLENLDNYLAEHGFMVPLDLGAKGTCTIGGNAATNAGGLRYLRYGSLRGNILGMEVVMADGTVVDSLSALRKDNTGYGLPQLFIGAEGTLGVITKLTLLVPPRPKAVNVTWFALQSYGDVQKMFALARSKLGEILSAVEFADRTAIDFVLEREAGTGIRDPFDDEKYPFYMLIETSGSSEDHDIDKLEKFCEVALEGEGDDDEGLVSNCVMAQDLAQSKGIWRLREGISDAMSTAGYVYKYDVSIPLPKMYDLVEATRKRLDEQGFTNARAAGYGHLGDANLHLNVTSLTGRDDELLKMLEPWIFEWVASVKGSISAEHGVGQCKPDYLHLSKSDSAIGMMKQLKALFDPKGILNPYKLFP